MKRTCQRRVIWVVLLAVAVGAAGWHGPGHELASRTAVAMLPKEMPAFFLAGGEAIAHSARDPDLFTRPIAPRELHAQEASEHYFDLELLAGEEVPATRYEFIELCARKGISPPKVGLLPYAIVEWTQRLTVAFAEHRKWPGNPHVRHKCLLYAGICSHYAQDLCMPLHTTIHWDGRANADGTSPRTGIHARADALLQKLPVSPAEAADGLQAEAFDDLMAAVMANFRASHALVDRLYELEARLPKLEDPLPGDSEASAFARERLRAAAAFTASLHLTAWRNSAKIELPEWHQRSDKEIIPDEAASRPAQPPAGDSQSGESSWRFWGSVVAAAVAGFAGALVLCRCRRGKPAGPR